MLGGLGGSLPILVAVEFGWLWVKFSKRLGFVLGFLGLGLTHFYELGFFCDYCISYLGIFMPTGVRALTL